MPKFYITTVSGRMVSVDDEGIEVADEAALERTLRRAIARIASYDGEEDCNNFSAFAVNEDGIMVMTVLLIMTTIIKPK
ncbi:DUF6894 family protein [Methylobacterium sp. J-076]|uniref:DUF6894 family protein n=1 Tax=Methylobacterium sp. J-076 TaxID=2836655 RepID=UPI001FBBAC01|nr:hypothetical protein [Methylobacterium sp. J-076]MCJ2011528.1 hypothetical protein [Methylobacterium sp. J-076]